ncbi:MAG: amidohydrolase family protein [Bryobacterales bacterium]
MSALLRSLALVCIGSALSAQTTLIRNATVHTLAGEPIEKGAVLIQDGKIAGVGRNLKAPKGATVIDAAGKHLYPGMFDAFTQVGLVEITAVDVTGDRTERGDFNPQMRTAIAIHPASEHIPVTRANGVTHTLSAMRGGIFSGRAAIVNMDGWTWEEMAIEADGPLVVEWPVIRVYPEDAPSDRPKTFEKAREEYDKKVREIAEWIESARHYAQAKKAGAAVNRKLEALLPLIEGRQPMIVVAERARTIRNAVEFAAAHDLKMILAGGLEAAKESALLKEHAIPVLLGPTQQTVPDEDDPYDELFAQPGELSRAGVPFAITSEQYYLSRTLPYEAAGAVPFGLPKDEALKAVTLYPAQILGLGDKLGSIEEGKIANLILTNGDPLEIQTDVERVFINGHEVSTDNKQRDLYEKYLARPKPTP